MYMNLLNKLTNANKSVGTRITAYAGRSKKDPLLEIYNLRNDLDMIVKNYDAIVQEQNEITNELKSIPIEDIRKYAQSNENMLKNIRDIYANSSSQKSKNAQK